MNRQMNTPHPLTSPSRETFDKLVARASDLSGISADELLAPTRGTKRTSVWRMCIFYILRTMGATYQSIGELFDRHYSTIMHGCDKIEGQAANPEVIKIIYKLTKKNGDTNDIKS